MLKELQQLIFFSVTTVTISFLFLVREPHKLDVWWGGGIKIDLHNLKGVLVELSEQQVISNIFKLSRHVGV